MCPALLASPELAKVLSLQTLHAPLGLQLASFLLDCKASMDSDEERVRLGQS